MIEEEARFKKEKIEKVASLKGKVNRKPRKLPNGRYPSGTLQFKRFCGRHIGDHIFAGVLQFEEKPEDKWDPERAADFSVLMIGIEEA